MTEHLTGKKEVVMDFCGDEKVIENILRKKCLLEKDDAQHEEISPVLIAPGGVQRGVIQGAIGIGLKRAEVVDAFDSWICISSGAPVGYYTLAGEPESGTEIFYKENVANKFVNFLRFWKIMDIYTLESVFRYEKPVDIKKLKSARPEFLVGITDSLSGEGVILNAKKLHDPLRAVLASINYPILNGGKTVFVNGMTYIDGGIGNPLPISYAIDELHATDILVAMNSPVEPKRSFPLLESLLSRTIYRIFTKCVRNMILTYNERYNSELAYLTKDRIIPKGVRIAAIYPKVMPITAFTMDRKLLMQGADAAADFTESLFQSWK